MLLLSCYLYPLSLLIYITFSTVFFNYLPLNYCFLFHRGFFSYLLVSHHLNYPHLSSPPPPTGVSSREAARALITLFNPRKPVPSSTSLSPEDHENDEDSFGGMNNGSFSSSTTSHNYASSPKSSPSSSSPNKRSSFNRRSQSFVAGSSSSGGGGSPSKLPPLLHSHSLTFSPAISPTVSPITPLLESQSHKGVLGAHRADAAISLTAGANAGTKTDHDAKAVADVLTASTSSTITNTTVTTNPNTNTTTTSSSSSGMGYNGKDMMSSLFLSENYARPWRFSYYHKRYVLLLFILQPSVTLVLA